MSFIDWNTASLNVNVAEIDQQHKKLVDLINTLHDAMRQGTGKAMIGKTLSELLEYTKYHFKTEETLFQKYNYSDQMGHKAEHDKLTKQAIDIKKQFDNGKMVVTLDLMNFLKKWLNEHILDRDKRFALFLNQKGIK